MLLGAAVRAVPGAARRHSLQPLTRPALVGLWRGPKLAGSITATNGKLPKPACFTRHATAALAWSTRGLVRRLLPWAHAVQRLTRLVQDDLLVDGKVKEKGGPQRKAHGRGHQHRQQE